MSDSERDAPSICTMTSLLNLLQMFLHQALMHFFHPFSLAGCIAQKMGLPIRLVTVVNSNDIIHRTVQHGDFSLAGSVKATLASAMDIQVCNELAKMQK